MLCIIIFGTLWFPRCWRVRKLYQRSQHRQVPWSAVGRERFGVGGTRWASDNWRVDQQTLAGAGPTEWPLHIEQQEHERVRGRVGDRHRTRNAWNNRTILTSSFCGQSNGRFYRATCIGSAIHACARTAGKLEGTSGSMNYRSPPFSSFSLFPSTLIAPVLKFQPFPLLLWAPHIAQQNDSQSQKLEGTKYNWSPSNTIREAGYFNVRLKADISQLSLPTHWTEN